MSVFIDTSAFVAMQVAEDENHQPAASLWKRLVDGNEQLVTSNYIIVETCALLQRRAGMSAVRTFLQDILSIVLVEWVDLALHLEGIAGLSGAARRGPNIVDCVSFAIMRKLAVTDAFTFDSHFSDQGFRLLKQ